MKEGIIASKIAAHAGDIAKKVKGARTWDNEMSHARVNLDWEKMFDLALDPERPREYRDNQVLEDEKTCSMCGKMCAVRNLNKTLNGEDVIIRA